MTGRIRPAAALALAALTALAVAGCEVALGPETLVRGSGNLKTESREVHGFDRVELSGVGTLNLTEGSTESLTVQAEDNLLPSLRSEVRGGALLLGPQPGTQFSPTRPISYDLTVQRLSALSVTGAADVRSSGLSADQLSLTVTGAAHVDLGRVTASALTVVVTGAGEVKAAGQAPQQSVTISGAGRYEAGDLASRQATVDVNGAGTCAVRVSDHLKVSITGAGSVSYTGSPAIDQQVTGTGRLTKAG